MQKELFSPDTQTTPTLDFGSARTLVGSLQSLINCLEYTMAAGTNLEEWARQLDNIAWLATGLRDAFLLLAKEERDHEDDRQADGHASTPGETGR